MIKIEVKNTVIEREEPTSSDSSQSLHSMATFTIGRQTSTLPDGSVRVRRNVVNGVAQSEEILSPDHPEAKEMAEAQRRAQQDLARAQQDLVRAQQDLAISMNSMNGWPFVMGQSFYYH